MRNIWSICCVGLVLAPGLAAAHGPSRQKVTEEIKIAAAPAKVWGVIKDFCSIEKWHPSVAKCEGTGGNAQGATRKLTLKGEGDRVIEEEMQEYDEAGMSFKYRITKVDVKVLPVTTYSSFMTVKPDGDGSIVTWNGAFYRGWQRNNPPPELSDEAAIKAVTGIFKEGLANLKTTAEK
jgi:hypothetical protein